MFNRIQNKYYIDRDIRNAETLPGEFYNDDDVFEQLKENIFSKTWQLAGNTDLVKTPVHSGLNQKT